MEIEHGLPITSGRGITLGQYFERQWLAVTLPQRVAAGRLAETTLDSYRDNAEKHIIPALGGEKLSKLTPTRIRQWLTELQAKPSGRFRRVLREGETELPPPATLSSRTVAYQHSILRKALNDAVRDEIVKRNAAALVEPPVVRRSEAAPPTKEQARMLLSVAAGDRLWAYWLIVLALGLRRGEGLGISWTDIDLDARTVRLRTSIQLVRGEKDEATGQRKGQLVLKNLKTDASHATVALPNFVADALREHRKAQSTERLAARMWEDTGLVFTTSIGTALEPRNVNREWQAVRDKARAGQFRIHDLRHAAATYLSPTASTLRSCRPPCGTAGSPRPPTSTRTCWRRFSERCRQYERHADPAHQASRGRSHGTGHHDRAATSTATRAHGND